MPGTARAAAPPGCRCPAGPLLPGLPSVTPFPARRCGSGSRRSAPVTRVRLRVRGGRGAGAFFRACAGDRRRWQYLSGCRSRTGVVVLASLFASLASGMPRFPVLPRRRPGPRVPCAVVAAAGCPGAGLACRMAARDLVPCAVVPGCGCDAWEEQFGFVDQGERAFVLSAGERFPGLRRQAGRCVPVAVRGCCRSSSSAWSQDLGVGGDVVADPALFPPGDIEVPPFVCGQPGRGVLGGAVAGGVPADGGG